MVSAVFHSPMDAASEPRPIPSRAVKPSAVVVPISPAKPRISPRFNVKLTSANAPLRERCSTANTMSSELRRVGCLTGNADGNWNNASQRSLTQFNRYAGTRLDTKVASVDTLDTIKLKSSRVCPLVCEHGFQADGDRCTRITCAEGSFLNDDNECEKRRAKKPVATRDRPESRRFPEAREGRQPKQVIVTRSQNRNAPGMSSSGRPLTGLERQQGCNGYQAIMSGVCP